MKRQSSPYQKFKKTLAPIFDRVSKDFDKRESRYMQKLFKHFKPEYHDTVANYPVWLKQNLNNYNLKENLEGLDYSAAFEYLCSYDVIETYLRIVNRPPKAAS